MSLACIWLKGYFPEKPQVLSVLPRFDPKKPQTFWLADYVQTNFSRGMQS